MEIKASLDPENKHLSSWTADGDPCGGAFEGVACNEHRKVANISLQGKGLAGKVSPAVAELKCLSGLYLHYNFLSGEIPKEIANLTELNDLYLNVNNFTGTIPPQIGSMASLQGLSNFIFFCRFYEKKKFEFCAVMVESESLFGLLLLSTLSLVHFQDSNFFISEMNLSRVWTSFLDGIFCKKMQCCSCVATI